MRDFPSCFGESGVQIVGSSSSSTNRAAAQNLVTCIYQYNLQGLSGFILVTWTKYLTGQGLSLEIQNSIKQCLTKVEIKPWLFTKRKGTKSIEVNSSKFAVHWDLSCAKFGPGPEPLEGFFVAINLNKELVLRLGDLEKDIRTDGSYSVPNATFIAKREQVFGKKVFFSKGQFHAKGKLHDIMIRCDAGPSSDLCLMVIVDRKEVLQVTRLRWKFRGNHTIMVDGFPVEVYWDVHSWLFDDAMGNGFFLFRTCISGAKCWNNQALLDIGMSSWSGLKGSEDLESRAQGFSLILCAWKND